MFLICIFSGNQKETNSSWGPPFQTHPFVPRDMHQKRSSEPDMLKIKKATVESKTYGWLRRVWVFVRYGGNPEKRGIHAAVQAYIGHSIPVMVAKSSSISQPFRNPTEWLDSPNVNTNKRYGFKHGSFRGANNICPSPGCANIDDWKARASTISLTFLRLGNWCSALS